LGGERLGNRRVLAAGVLWWGVFTALVAAVPSKISHALLVFIAIRFLFGAGESADIGGKAQARYPA